MEQRFQSMKNAISIQPHLTGERGTINTATMFRMEVFKDVQYDVSFPGQGYEHEDIFLQLGNTPWKIVNYNSVSVFPLVVETPKWYGKLRGMKVSDSRKYLFKKWNLMGLR